METKLSEQRAEGTAAVSISGQVWLRSTHQGLRLTPQVIISLNLLKCAVITPAEKNIESSSQFVQSYSHMQYMPLIPCLEEG